MRTCVCIVNYIQKLFNQIKFRITKIIYQNKIESHELIDKEEMRFDGEWAGSLFDPACPLMMESQSVPFVQRSELCLYLISALTMLHAHYRHNKKDRKGFSILLVFDFTIIAVYTHDPIPIFCG